jgi:hypothetical protein
MDIQGDVPCRSSAHRGAKFRYASFYLGLRFMSLMCLLLAPSSSATAAQFHRCLATSVVTRACCATALSSGPSDTSALVLVFSCIPLLLIVSLCLLLMHRYLRTEYTLETFASLAWSSPLCNPWPSWLLTSLHSSKTSGLELI